MTLRHDAPHPVAPPHFSTQPDPADVRALLRLASDDEVSFAKLGDALAEQGAVAFAFLRAASSIGEGAGQPIRSVRHALALLGLQRTRMLLLELQDQMSQEQKRNATGLPQERRTAS